MVGLKAVTCLLHAVDSAVDSEQQQAEPTSHAEIPVSVMSH